jgi:hypothetical protein
LLFQKGHRRVTKELDVTTLIKKLRLLDVLSRLVLNTRQRSLVPYYEELYISDHKGVLSFSEEERAPLNKDFEEKLKRTLKKSAESKRDEKILKMLSIT